MRYIFLVLFFINNIFAQSTENVFIVVIDGPRYSETFGDSNYTLIPVMGNILKPLGAFYSSFYNNGTTKTNSGHSSILTGIWQSIRNDGSERPSMPTIFEYYRKHVDTSANSCFVVLGKTKLDVLSFSTHPEYGSKYAATVKYSKKEEDDRMTFENIKEVVKKYRPKMLISNFAGVDISAHDEDFESYTTKIKIVDSLMGELWNFIQSDSIYKDKTTLFITNDHGRHLDSVKTGFRDHGDDCEGCRHISLLILGPDTPAGIIDTTMYEQTDIAPTISRMLKFEMPYSKGKVIESALRTESINKTSNTEH